MTSDPILDELARTFDSPYFAAKLSRQQRRENVELLRSEARVVGITRTVRGVATHSEDDLILSTALSARVDALVTGDHQLVKLATYEGVAILSPRGFLDMLEAT